jgi:hypothetical protein
MNNIGDVTGIPTDRATWIATLRERVDCNEQHWIITQKILFHITGSGQVIEGPTPAPKL